jgi:hypothetical protein
MKIPSTCDFCGRATIRVTPSRPAGELVYGPVCDDCAEPKPQREHPGRVRPFPVKTSYRKAA